MGSFILHLPFGGVAGYTLGNGQTLQRAHNLDHHITDVTSPALELHFRRDAAGNIDRLGTAPGAASPVEEYLYDDLYRLLAVQDDLAADIETYAYDLIGNRQSKTSAAGTELYDYAIGSHHLIEVGGSGRTYDAVGNLIADQSDNQTYTYGDHNRLVGYSRPGLSASYTYNGRGERASKFVMGTDQTSWAFLYDEAGRLLIEHSASVMPPPPHFYRKYVYLDDIPVALIDYDHKVYYLHADHLGTPRAVTDHTGTRRWAWSFQSNPFGEQLPDQDPDNTGSTFTLNLRFPGQYYDAETGLHYNYYRDYEPGTGRYIESDPIGLDGGLSTYSYALATPLIATDPRGLAVEVCCRLLDSVAGWMLRRRHCYFAVDGLSHGLYPESTPVLPGSIGIPRPGDPRDDGGKCKPCEPMDCEGDPAACVRQQHEGCPVGQYFTFGPNSNTYVGSIARSCCKGGVPSGLGSAPGIDQNPPMGFAGGF